MSKIFFCHLDRMLKTVESQIKIHVGVRMLPLGEAQDKKMWWPFGVFFFEWDFSTQTCWIAAEVGFILVIGLSMHNIGKKKCGYFIFPQDECVLEPELCERAEKLFRGLLQYLTDFLMWEEHFELTSELQPRYVLPSHMQIKENISKAFRFICHVVSLFLS